MPSKKIGILLALLLVLIALIVYRVVTREEPKRVKELTYKSGIRVQKPDIKIEKTEKGKGHQKMDKVSYKGVIKNPFQPLYPPEPRRPIVPRIAVPAQPPFSAITSKGPSPAQMEAGNIKFLGFLQKEGGKKIFLSKEKEVFIVKIGDSIGNLQIKDITDNSVTLLSKDGAEEFRLTIEDVKPTKPGILGGGRR